MHFLPYVYNTTSNGVMVELSMATLHGLSAADTSVTLFNQLRRIFSRVEMASRYDDDGDHHLFAHSIIVAMSNTARRQ